MPATRPHIPTPDIALKWTAEGCNKYINKLSTQTFWRDYLGEIEGM